MGNGTRLFATSQAPSNLKRSPEQRLSNMLVNLARRKPGTLRLSRDEIRQVLKMRPKFHHKWGISDALGDLYAGLMMALDFRHTDSWKWVEQLVDDYGGERFYMELERNPTTPRTFWEPLQYSGDLGAKLAAKDMLGKALPYGQRKHFA